MKRCIDLDLLPERADPQAMAIAGMFTRREVA